VRLLLLDHDDGEAFASAIRPHGFQIAVSASKAEPAPGHVATVEAVVLGTKGPIEQRAERCRQLRSSGYTGAVVGICTNVAEGEALLKAGADDFVTAPYPPLELATRLRACASRAAAAPSRLHWGSMDLDRVSRVLHLPDRTVPLTDRECGLLACLMQAGGSVVSRSTLRERVWHRKEDRGTNLVEVHLSRLREKLGEHATVIETVRNTGYRLRRDVR